MKKLKGKLIIIEGGDGAGKATQAELLISALKKAENRVSYFDFPQYEGSFFGALTGRALKGEFGDFRHLSPYFASLAYMLDRHSAVDKLYNALKKGVVVCNRYTPSSVAFQSTKLAKASKKAFIEFIEQAEYVELGLPRPTAVIYLNVPPTFSFEMIGQKDRRSYLDRKKSGRDQHETDRRYQSAVVRTYLELARSRPDWHVIECTEKGKLLSREDIHAKVMKVISKI